LSSLRELPRNPIFVISTVVPLGYRWKSTREVLPPCIEGEPWGVSYGAMISYLIGPVPAPSERCRISRSASLGRTVYWQRGPHQRFHRDLTRGIAPWRQGTCTEFGYWSAPMFVIELSLFKRTLIVKFMLGLVREVAPASSMYSSRRKSLLRAPRFAPFRFEMIDKSAGLALAGMRAARGACWWDAATLNTTEVGSSAEVSIKSTWEHSPIGQIGALRAAKMPDSSEDDIESHRMSRPWQHYFSLSGLTPPPMRSTCSLLRFVVTHKKLSGIRMQISGFGTGHHLHPNMHRTAPDQPYETERSHVCCNSVQFREPPVI
jgi:hypothetical protein